MPIYPCSLLKSLHFAFFALLLEQADITDGPGVWWFCHSVTLITSIVAQSIYHQIARKEEEEEDHTNNAPGLQVSGLDLTLLAGLPVLLQSCLSASWDSFDDKFSLLPGVSTPLDQNTVKHSLVGLSVLASLNRLNPECKLDY